MINTDTREENLEVEYTTLDAALLSKMFLAGAKNLDAKKEWINELNVFPVPDGDTGTNMSMTIISAAKEVSALTDPDMAALAKAISSGSLRGARGNSGVILSQLFRGFTKVIKTEKEIDKMILCQAIEKACETAYKAVMKPKEGTILTVAKGVADKAIELSCDEDCSMAEYLKAIFAEAEAVLAKTPEMLPVLKQAGVVDSGGQGLVEVLRGALDAYQGKEIDYTIEGVEAGSAATTGSGIVKISAQTEQEIKFGYCTEFIINLEKVYTDKDETELKSYLESIGDSLVVVSDDEIVKVHVHTNHPGLAFEKALAFGSLSRMKIDNMREEHQERVIQDSERLAREQAAREQEDKDKATGEEAPSERREYGFIAVSSGEGLSDIFRGIGADCLIEGGQTMNPSTEDMLKAIERVNAENIFILPNNKNIIMAAQQARDLTEDKNIIVIPSRTVPQGITALVNFMPDLGPEENTQTMTEEMGNVRTAQITYAVRTTNIDGIDIEEGDIMALGDHGMLAVGKSVDGVALDAMKEMLDEECELVTIYYGADVSEHEAKVLEEQAQEQYPDKEIELQYGGQPIYYYLISAE